MAEKREDGYLSEDFVYVHIKLVDHRREWIQVVVPSCRHQEFIDVCHKNLTVGHFFHNKLVASHIQQFT